MTEIRMCCCQGFEEYQQHEETQKFKLLTQEKSAAGTKLLLHEEAEFEDETGPELQFNRYSTGYMVGRNIELERIAKHLRGGVGQSRVVILAGPPGAGKTETARRAS